jgi:DNA repair photolyase
MERIEKSGSFNQEKALSEAVTSLRLLSNEEIEGLVPSLADPIEPRKSGLSVNHIIGCPMECIYCVRHKDDNFAMKTPRMIMSDAEVVEKLLKHPYFIKNLTPLQLLNKATDGFVPSVKPHLFRVLELLDQAGLQNDVLLITRYRVLKPDCDFLNSLKNLRITLLITYSGIESQVIEPIPNSIPIQSLKTAYLNAKKFKVILYWRPIVPGLNDSDAQIDFVLAELSAHAHATVFTGLFYGEKTNDFLVESQLSPLASATARRKIFPEALEKRILARLVGTPAENKLFRKTSCAVCFTHGRPDYNGHYGIVNSGEREICEICPKVQQAICKAAHKTPSETAIRVAARNLGHENLRFSIEEGKAIIVEHMTTESIRYYLQHYFGFQFHDEAHAHKPKRHGRADIGWEEQVSAEV